MRARNSLCSPLVTCASALAPALIPLALSLTVLAPREARA